jgi:hypothetical protein
MPNHFWCRIVSKSVDNCDCLRQRLGEDVAALKSAAKDLRVSLAKPRAAVKTPHIASPKISTRSQMAPCHCAGR